MFAIAANALYTTLRKRGTTRQLAGAIVTCVLSALLLLPAIVWYNLRFGTEQAALSLVEVEVVLVYVALWGWCLPFAVTASYYLFTLPRTSTTSTRIPSQKRTTRENDAAKTILSMHQPGVPAPLVFDEDTPWGWLEHRGGRFQGQRLALTRAVVTIGREEDNDIWLDDDLASRHHAELIWEQGRVLVVDNNSLNGVILNARRIRNSAIVEHGALLEVGSHRFLFEYATPPTIAGVQDDPLLRHARPTAALEETTTRNEVVSVTKQPDLAETRAGEHNKSGPYDGFPGLPQSDLPQTALEVWKETKELDQVTPLPQPASWSSAFVVSNGELAGRSFLLDRPVITLGRGLECEVLINDDSISRRHAQILRQPNGDYVQDLASRNGTKVNDESLTAPRLLQHGDVVCLGNICMMYTSVAAASTSPLPPIALPPRTRPISGPVPLRLPSKPKNL
jgi:pSer/pThr/pTyr-binding forkhead associated (FHA) protein